MARKLGRNLKVVMGIIGVAVLLALLFGLYRAGLSLKAPGA